MTGPGKAEAVSRLVTAYGRVSEASLWLAEELVPPARGQWTGRTVAVDTAARLVDGALRLVATRVELCETDYARSETYSPVVVMLPETAPWGLVSPVRDAAERMRVRMIMVNRDGTVTPGPSPFAPARDENETETL